MTERLSPGCGLTPPSGFISAEPAVLRYQFMHELAASGQLAEFVDSLPMGGSRPFDLDAVVDAYVTTARTQT